MILFLFLFTGSACTAFVLLSTGSREGGEGVGADFGVDDTGSSSIRCSCTGGAGEGFALEKMDENQDILNEKNTTGYSNTDRSERDG